jgi:gliding motility-associated-like protein
MYSKQPKRISPRLFIPLFLILQSCVGLSQQLNTGVFPSRVNKSDNNSGTLSVSTSLQVNTTVTSTTCSMENGSILATASGGTPPYTYSFAGWPFQSSRLWLCRSGTYPVTIKDAIGATASTMAVVKNNYPYVWGVSVTMNDASGCTASDGSVRIDAYAGTPPYTYSLDNINFQASETFTNLLPGQYFFIIKDASGCTYVNWFYIRSSNCIVLNAATRTMSTYVCNNEGSIDFSLPTATHPVSYSLDGINYQSSGLFKDLTAGKHTLYMKDGDGKKYAYAINMYGECPIVTSAAATDATCGNNDGSIVETVTRGTPPYQYSIDGVNFQSNNIFSSISAGKYTIIVKDAAGLLKMDTTTVAENCPTVTATSIAATCGNSGSITAAVTKGTAPIQFSIDGITYQSSNIFTGVGSGNYTVTVKDANGNTASCPVTVVDNCNNIVLTPVHTRCGYPQGEITVSATFGTGPYTYSINGGIYNGTTWQTSNEFTGLWGSTYTITAKDALGITATSSITINDVREPHFSVDIVPADCNNAGAMLTINPIGGISPYQYSIDGIIWQPSNVFNVNAVNPGRYTAYIRGANGCGASICCYWIGTLCLNLNVVGKGANCNNNDGTITVTASNGTTPYEFSIDGVNYQSGNVFTGLTPNTYTVYARDAAGLTNKQNVTIDNVCLSVVVSATDAACGKSNGTITVTAANGTTPYTYSIDGVNFQTNNIFSSQAQGNYIITVKDAVGYSITGNISVKNSSGPQIAANAIAASCSNNDGSITVSATGGTQPYSFAINNGSFQNSGSFSNLAKGGYTATIKDAKGCTASQSVIVDLTNTLSVDAGADITICEGTTGSIKGVSNGDTFSWSPVTDLSNTTILSPNVSAPLTTKYYITALLGICEKKDSVIVIVNPAPIANAGSDIVICYGQSTQLNGNGGVQYNWSPITYLNNPTISNPTAVKPTGAVTYGLTVTDANGCKSIQDESVTITVTPPAKVFAGNDTAVYMNDPLHLNAVDVNNSGFTKYTWSPASGLNNPFIQNPVATTSSNITYTVVSTTPGGCEGRDSITIKAFAIADIFVPTAFTPNDDGRNDTFKAIPIGIREFKYFEVYNRWGQRVFFTTNPSTGWNGIINGIAQQTDIYVWRAAGITFKGNLIERKGTVVLIR